MKRQTCWQRPVLTRTWSLRVVRTGYAYQTPACCTPKAQGSLSRARRYCTSLGRTVAPQAEADADAATQLLEFEMTQERLGMGPAEGCVGGKSWVCHVDDHVVSLALVDNTHGPLISAVCRG